MTFWRIMLTVLFFAIIPTSPSVFGDEPLKEDVKFDEVQANKDDFKKKNKANDTNTDSNSKVLIAGCSQQNCPK